MQRITHIHADQARRIHADLVAALGTETVPHQWMTFMRTVREHLPDVLSRGRPTKAAIDSSPIGALGFTSWKAMCEAEVTDGGLGLPWSQWRQWSRAWAVVQKHPQLEGAPLTAAMVNRLHAESSSADEPMPATMGEIEAFEARQAERKQAAREETQTALKQRVEALEADLAASREEVARTAGVASELREQLAAAQGRQAEEVEARRSAEQERQQAMADLRALQQQYEDSQTDAQNRFQRQDREIQSLQRELRRYQQRNLVERIWAVFSP